MTKAPVTLCHLFYPISKLTTKFDIMWISQNLDLGMTTEFGINEISLYLLMWDFFGILRQLQI